MVRAGCWSQPAPDLRPINPSHERADMAVQSSRTNHVKPNHRSPLLGSHRPTTTPQQHRIFLDLYVGGMSLQLASKAAGFAAGTGKSVLRKHGITVRQIVSRFSSEQVDQFVEDYKSGQTQKEIARKAKCSQHTVWDLLTKRGVDKRPCGFDHWTDDEIAELRRVYPSQGHKPLLESLGRSRDAIMKVASELGLVSHNKAKFIGNTVAANNNSVNQDYFATWSPNMAWLLGYIWADGCVTQGHLRFGCVAQDDYLLEAIKKELQSTHKFTRRIPPDRPGISPMSRLVVSSRNLVRSLVELHGLAPDKCHKDLPFPSVPDEYLGHFARGNLDGDGCVSPKKKSAGQVMFLGTDSWIRGFQAALCRVADVRPLRVYNKNSLHWICWWHIAEIRRLHDMLYPEGDYIFLRRKREKFATMAQGNTEVRAFRNTYQ